MYSSTDLSNVFLNAFSLSLAIRRHAGFYDLKRLGQYTSRDSSKEKNVAPSPDIQQN